MELSRAASLLSFIAALVIGTAVGYVGAERKVEVVVDPPIAWAPEPVIRSAPEPFVEDVPVRAEDLRGLWQGEWGGGGESCTIEIRRIDGNTFYGTLRQEGAEIAIVGTLDADARTVFIHETKVIKVGSTFSEWSLGTNFGTFSADGRTLTGTGIDRWGTYVWNASKN